MTDLLDLMRPPPIRRPVDPDGPVVRAPQEVVEITDGPRLWRYARIQPHPTDEGLWMWATQIGLSSGGCGRQVGEKWGCFAASRADALHYAVEEILAFVATRGDGSAWARRVAGWARALT